MNEYLEGSVYLSLSFERTVIERITLSSMNNLD